MSEWFIINDIDDFTDKARAIVYNNFGAWDRTTELDLLVDRVHETEQEEFDKVLTHAESLIIVKQYAKKQKNKKRNKTRYLLNDKIFLDIVQNLNTRMVSNLINALVQKGLVETAFDSEANDFVFWVKDDENAKDKEKPETD